MKIIRLNVFKILDTPTFESNKSFHTYMFAMIIKKKSQKYTQNDFIISKEDLESLIYWSNESWKVKTKQWERYNIDL